MKKITMTYLLLNYKLFYQENHLLEKPQLYKYYILQIKRICEDYKLKYISLSEIIPEITTCNKESNYHQFKRKIMKILTKGLQIPNDMYYIIIID